MVFPGNPGKSRIIIIIIIIIIILWREQANSLCIPMVLLCQPAGGARVRSVVVLLSVKVDGLRRGRRMHP